MPLGILSIASFLKSKGHDAVICDRFFTSEKADATLKRLKPDIIGVSVMSNVFIKDAMDIAKEAKKLGIPVVWGGSLASVIPEEILRSGLGDYVSFNEGEFTWLEMAEAFDKGEPFDSIKGLGYIRNGEYIRTENREFIDLSVLPKLDWTIIDPKQYFQMGYGYDKMITTYFSKGCTGRCTFCYNHKFHCSTAVRDLLNMLLRRCAVLLMNTAQADLISPMTLCLQTESRLTNFAMQCLTAV